MRREIRKAQGALCAVTLILSNLGAISAANAGRAFDSLETTDLMEGTSPSPEVETARQPLIHGTDAAAALSAIAPGRLANPKPGTGATPSEPVEGEPRLPTNDFCQFASPIFDGMTPFSNVGMTTDGPSEPSMCNYFSDPQVGSDIWYCYTATCTGNLTVSLCGSSYDTKVAVYNGCSCPASSPPLACNDDFCSLQSQVLLPVMAGSQYLIRVGGYLGAQGSGQIQITCGAAGCTVPCAGGTLENEPACGIPTDTLNGGCNSPSFASLPIACGQSYCGTVGASGGTRDSDWYSITFTQPTTLSGTLNAEFASQLAIVQLQPDCNNIAVLATVNGSPCLPAALTAVCLPPGTYYWFVAPVNFDGVPCGSRYTTGISCTPCGPAVGACCHGDGTCTEGLPQSGCNSPDDIYLGDGSTCAAVACSGRCCYTTLGGIEQCESTNAVRCSGPNYNGIWNVEVSCGVFCPTGRCCYISAGLPACGDFTEDHCNDVAGSWLAGGACASQPCSQSLQACCLSNICSDMDPATCTSQGGVPQGSGTSCATSPCGITGACCHSDQTCTETSPTNCQLPDVYRGDFTSCEMTDCVPNSPDCNQNGITDSDDIAAETSRDCNENSIPDECEIGMSSSLDCDGDGILDSCEINVSPAQDCDGDGILDTCQSPSDSDGDGVPDCSDMCPLDSGKTSPGTCGCGVADTDSDDDGVADCADGCPTDPNESSPGPCGCGTSDVDTDWDGTPDCLDGCPLDGSKISPGICGCNSSDSDSDNDNSPDCTDPCMGPNSDSDGDGSSDCVDACPSDPQKVEPGYCGCGVTDADTDGDTIPDCIDDCPTDSTKTDPGYCGCGVAEVDSDEDGVPDCADGCPDNPTTSQTCTGYCCFASGTCEELTSSDCAAGGGTYGGDGSLCEDADCPGPELPICLGDMNADGSVDGRDVQPFVDCALTGSGNYCERGDFNNDTLVSQSDVGPFVNALLFGSDCGGQPGDPVGACLLFGSCYEITEVDCDTAGGDYLGDNTTCPCDEDSLDLGIDSNNNGLTFIDIENDDPIEENAPGKFILLNDDDDDANAQSDKDQAGVTDGENDLVPLVISSTCNGDARRWKITFPNKVKIWHKSKREGAITSGQLYNLPLPGVAYVEGIANSAQLGDVEIELSVVPAAGGAAIATDKVKATVFSIDIDLDSDNSNAVADFGPQRDAAEDAVEDTTGRLGRAICVNDDDDDKDEIVDSMDGYNMDRQMGNDDDQTMGEDDFVRMVIEIPAPIDVTVAKVRFLPSVDMRIWKKDGPLARVFAFPPLPTDYVLPLTYDATALGLTNNQRSVNLWIEATRKSAGPGRARVRVEMDPDGAGPAGFVGEDAVRATLVRAEIMRHDGTPAGLFAPLFRMTPLIRMADVPSAFDTGADTYDHGDTGRAYDVITYVTKVERSITNFDNAATDGQWEAVTITDNATLPAAGNSYESRFTVSLGDLNSLRNRPLGSRRRILYRATSVLGRTAYEELILEVRLNAAREKRIFPINLGPASNAAAPEIPNVAKHRLELEPTPPNDNTEVMTLSTKLYTATYPDGTLVLKGSDIQQPVEFVFADSAQFALRATNPQQHFFPHLRVSGASEVVSRYKNGSSCGRAYVIDFNLNAFLSDDSTEDVVPVSVRHNDTGVAVTQTNNVTGNSREYRFLLLPLNLIVPSLPASARPRNGEFRLELVGANPGVTVWNRHFPGDAEPWFPLALPFVHQFSNQPNSWGSLADRQFALLGMTPNAQTTLRATFTYKGAIILEDKILLKVVPLPGLAGASLAGEFPYIRFAHTFNRDNAANVADTVSLALDPFQWPHLCGNYTLPAGNARPAARFSVVNHKSSEEWLTNNAFVGTNEVVDRLDGRGIRYNVKNSWPNAATAGDYDTVIDLAGENGSVGPNGKLDAGDIIGRLTPHNADAAQHRKLADAHVVEDPGTKTEYAASAYAEYQGPYFDTGGGRMFARLRGRIQYPVDTAAAWAGTPARIVGARGRTPNGTFDNFVFNYGGVGAGFQGEYWHAVFDGTQWWLRSSEDGGQGNSGAAVAGRWTLTSTNTRLTFRIIDGATAFQQGDVVWLNVTRAPIAQGPFPLVMVAHGNHNHFIVTPPKYMRFIPAAPGVPASWRHQPGANGINDEQMTVYDLRPAATGGVSFLIAWDQGNTRWDIVILPGGGLDSHAFATVATGVEFDMPATVDVPRTGLPDVTVNTGGRFRFKINANGPAVGTFFYLLRTGSTADTPNESYRGYSYLMDHLARNGFAVLSVSLDDLQAERFTTGLSRSAITERANIINEHFRRFESGAGGVDNLRADLGLNGRIAFADPTLIGHSRGGEAVVRATTVGGVGGRYTNAQIVSIAPTDALPATETVATNPYLVIYGSHDGDLSDGPAFRLYDRATGAKQLLHLNLANHNYFNESWPESDLGGGAPDGFNGAANAAGSRTQHRAVARSYIPAFINAHVDRTGINSANIPARDYFAEFYNRSPISLRPPAINNDVVYSQYLGALGPAAGRTRTDVQNFDDPAAPDRQNQNFPAGAGRRYRQATFAGEFDWATWTPPTVKPYAVTTGDFRQRDAITLRVAQRQFLPETPGAGNVSSTPLALTLQIADGSTPPRYLFVQTDRLTAINVPIDRGGGLDLQDARGDSQNKANYVTIRVPTNLLGIDGRSLDLANISSISIIADQPRAGSIAIDDIGADR